MWVSNSGHGDDRQHGNTALAKAIQKCSDVDGRHAKSKTTELNIHGTSLIVIGLDTPD